jgi:tRNA (Thr-GGU) A37 N-methylase
MDYTMKVIARIHSDFPEKFGIPRQSGLVPALRAKIVFEPEYRNPDALRGIEGFSHLWLIWQFSAAVCARRALAATSAWAFLQRARRSARTPSAFPA